MEARLADLRQQEEQDQRTLIQRQAELREREHELELARMAIKCKASESSSTIKNAPESKISTLVA